MSRLRFFFLRTALGPFRMRKLNISGSLIIFIARMLDDHFSRMLVVIFIRMRVFFVPCNLHEIEMYPNFTHYTFLLKHTSYNTSFDK